MKQIVKYESNQIRLKTDTSEQVWFAAIDIAKVLGYQNISDILEKKLDDDEKKLDYQNDRSGQRRKTWNINEFGLYSLILSSKKPEAKQFKRWITHEVLPSIRKAGKYNSEDEREHELRLQTLADEIQKLKDKKDFHQKKANELKREIDKQTNEMLKFIKADRSQLQIPFDEEQT